MKKYALLSLLLFISSTLFAQEKSNTEVENVCIHKDNITFSVGYGAPSIVRTYLKLKNAHADFKIVGWGPYMFKVDYMLRNKWSIGLNFTYNFSRISWMDDGYDTVIHGKRPYEYGIEAEDFSLTCRANYHFIRNKKMDVYAGLGAGYGKITLGTYTEAPLNQFSVGYAFPRPLSVETTIGIRYYIIKNIAIYSELGMGKSWILFKKYFIPESIIQGGIHFKI